MGDSQEVFRAGSVTLASHRAPPHFVVLGKLRLPSRAAAVQLLQQRSAE
jgi:hypothetical protein